MLLAASGLSAFPQASLIVPTPHQISAQGATFEAPGSFRLEVPATLKNSIAVMALNRDSLKFSKDAPMALVMGLKGDKSVKKLAGMIPGPEGYCLSVTPKEVMIAGADETGLYYGVQSLLAMMADGLLEQCTIADAPDVPFRGVVEGFYGTPWSHSERLSMLEFLGRHKMNSYFYGPKDDPFHRDRWREPYPEKEGKEISELAQAARDRGVNFYWAIHPGADIVWDGSERREIVDKFRHMHDLGVRAFAVFFDDISGEGTKATRQAELLNYIDSAFIAANPDVAPLVMCPTVYNEAFQKSYESDYLDGLRENLNQGVQVMWTGRNVMADIDSPTMDWVNPKIGRKAFIWWNFPVSDYVKDKVLLGPAYGNTPDIADKLAGFVSNPMQYPEASKIAIYGVGDYLWNMKAYNPDRAWNEAISLLIPGAAEEMKLFASFNQNPFPNWQKFSRKENEELKPVAEKALAGDQKALMSLAETCGKLKAAALQILADSTNLALVDELRPWLEQAINIGDFGITACTLATSSPQLMQTMGKPYVDQLIKYGDAQRKHIDSYDKHAPFHDFQTGVKLGTTVLLPTLDSLYQNSKERLK